MSTNAYTLERAHEFCEELTASCNVSKACKLIGVTRRTAYNWRDIYAEFKTNWDNSIKIGAQALEDEALRRGFEGYDKPVYQQGMQVGTITEYSDTLAVLLLKAHNPERFRERTQTDLNVSGELDIAARLAAGRKRVGS